MAEIAAFRGVRYNTPRSGPLADLVAPPYDIIGADERRRLEEKSPYNVVRIDLPRPAADDPGGDAGYARAGELWRQWRRRGILRLDARPALYVYEQRYRLPGGSARRVRGVIAALRLAHWEEGIVLPHEHTFAQTKADRLALMRATQAQLSPIYAFCSDPARTLDALLGAGPGEDPPAAAVRVEDAEGTVHTLWALDEMDQLRQIASALRPLPLFIADGHHRYETALAFRNETTRAGSVPGATHVMTMIVNIDAGGVSLLPTHRIVLPFPGFDEASLRARAAELFDFSPIQGPIAPDPLLNALADERIVACLGFPPGRWFAVAAKDRAELESRIEPSRSAAVRQLDVTIVHDLLLHRCLGLDPERQASGEAIRYTRSAAEAIAAVAAGEAVLAILLRAPTPAQVRDVARAGDVMPHKSTYFYPKLLTGLVFSDLTIPVQPLLDA
ncbi:MAG TPA: DUF1015 domain-containing protein [Limnochordia bacterium]